MPRKSVNLMKKLFIILLSVVALSFVGCENGKNFNSHGFEGNYSMSSTSYLQNEDGSYDSVASLYNLLGNVEMYVKSNRLYIQTNNYGMPNFETEGIRKYELTLTRNIAQSPSLYEDIEPVYNPYAQIFISNGYVIVSRWDSLIMSHPIKALDVKDDQILFRNSDDFDVPILDGSGNTVSNFKCHFEYAPARLINDTIFWGIELFGKPYTVPNSLNMTKIYVKYNNILVRK